jgi:APA family basic amino acid/polyamine antiporter
MTDAPLGKPPQRLKREVGLGGAVMMGLGAMVGTGVFVSIGVAAGSAGPAVILAIALVAIVAACNGLSAAQLAAACPVSGGTYEYGHRWLHPSLGFVAGWMFLCAKTASAATAALGFGGYVLQVSGVGGAGWLVPLALAAVAVLTVLVLGGMRQSSRVNVAVVSVSLLALLYFIVAGLPTALRGGAAHLTPFFGAPGGAPAAGFFESCALMFVAFTGYSRIATLGEEIKSPRRNIPLATIATVLIAMLLYVGVAYVAVACVGAEALAAASSRAAPLEVAARQFGIPGAGWIVALGAIAAMLGVLLNLLLGLSRVVLAMGRRNDVPSLFARLDRDQTTPYAAVVAVGLGIAGLVLLGDVKVTWSFSAFTVLVYYALTNLAALRMTPDERRYPRIVPLAGLLSCLFLAFWVEPTIWLIGLGLIAAGLVWWFAARVLERARAS